MKRPGVNAFHNAFETDINPITQTTSEGGLGHIPDKTGQVQKHLVVETTYVIVLLMTALMQHAWVAEYLFCKLSQIKLKVSRRCSTLNHLH